MTREEAIIQLRLGPGINEDVSEKYNDAVNMAIEALNGEQEKYDAICSELVALKNNLNEPIEVAMAYEKALLS